jgi:hypothetical protein
VNIVQILCAMYVNEKMTPVETTPGIKGDKRKWWRG